MIISIPLYIFLFIYFGFLVIFFLFVGINFFHIIKSGTLTFTNFLITALAAATTIFILFGTFQLLQGTDWQQTITLFNANWFANVLPEPTFWYAFITLC